MKKFLEILVLVFFINNAIAETTVKLPKDVSSGSKFYKSLTGKYYKNYGYQKVKISKFFKSCKSGNHRLGKI